MPAISSAAEFAQALWPLMSVSTTGLSGVTASSIDRWGGDPIEAESHCPPAIQSPPR
jgi:hypothetical protein